ncbi:hypothetical protein [Halosimplex marinum]
MSLGINAVLALLAVIATVNVAQFAHQLRFASELATHEALPPERAHGRGD